MRWLLTLAILAVVTWPVAALEGKKVQPDTEKLQGKWKIVSFEADGEKEFEQIGHLLVFQGDKFSMFDDELKFQLDPKKTPKQIDAKGKSSQEGFPPIGMVGIYRLEGDKLTLCYVPLRKDERRPTEFKTDEGRRSGALMVLERVKEKGQDDKEPAAKLPEGLRHVPLDAVGFIHVRAGDFLKSPVGKILLQELQQDREAANGLKQIEQTLGIEAADLESVTLLMLAPPTRLQMNPWDWPGRRPNYKERFRDGDKVKPDPQPKAGDKEAPVLFQEFGRSAQPGVQREEDQPDMDALDEILAFGPLVIVTSTGALDRKKILKSQLFSATAGDQSVLFLSDRTVMVGAAWELARYSEAMARKPDPKAQPMKSALALAAEPHLVVAGGHLPADLRRMMLSLSGHEMRELAPLSPLLQTEGGLSLDFDKGIQLNLQFHAPTEASAAIALQSLKSLRVLAELALEKSREAAESGGWKLQLEKGMAKALADASIEQRGTTVKAQVKMEISPVVVKHFTKEFAHTLRHRGDRTQRANNLKQIGVAMHMYHDVTKALPPAGISDPKGRPLLSWRVAILPYIEQEALYRQFDLNQPWDHPTNKKLIAQMPALYKLPGAEAKEGETHYRVLVGPTTMFEPRKDPEGRAIGVKLLDAVDGTANTIMAVEAKESTIWTRPDDLPFDAKGPLPKFGVAPDGFNVLMGDGSVRFIRSTTPQEVLRAMITRNGGESVPDHE